MFPFDLEEDELDIDENEQKEPRDYEIDLKTGKLTGKVVTGIKALEQWIYITLGTDRYFYTQYSWNHGCELSSLIGKSESIEYVKSEVKRMIEEALSVNDYITGIENVECSIEKDVLKVKFTVQTEFGEVKVNV